MNKATNKKAPRLEEKARGGIEATPASVAHFDGPASVETSPMLDAALSLAESGFSVLPLLTGTKRPFKGSHGVHDATRNRTQIRQWWMQTPTANIALATGEVSGCFALDVDAKSGGLDSLARLVAEHGPLPETPRQSTPGGGEHYLFRWPGRRVRNSIKSIAPGIDVRGDRGYIVAAPSRLANGRGYRWIADPRSTPLAHPPEWVHRLLQNDGDHSVGSVVRLFCNSLEEAIERSLPRGEGERNRCIFTFARLLKGMPEYAQAQPRDLRPVFHQWWTAALPKIRTQAWEDSWIDFINAWPNAWPLTEDRVMSMLAESETKPPPPEAGKYECPTMRRLVALCRELQHAAGDKPFYLSCAKVEEVLATDRMTAWRRLKLLVADGVLEVVTPGSQLKATRYKFRGVRE